MAAFLAYNWQAQTNAIGSFNAYSTGYVQGVSIDDPATRFQLAGGVLSQNETLPMWGGVAINETTTPNTGALPPSATQGGIISRATNISSTGAAGCITGFSVFDQNYAMTITPQSPVPMSGSGMQVNFYRLGTNRRIPVACSSSLVGSPPEGSSISQQVSWDFVNQQLIPYIAAYASASVASATYTSSTGILSLTFGSAPFGAGIGTGADGVYISISGITTSAGPASVVNGDFPITSTASAGTVINVQAAAGAGTITINSATGALAAGGGALPVRLLEIVGNSMTVNYNATTNTATWNYQGNVALILI